MSENKIQTKHRHLTVEEVRAKIAANSEIIKRARSGDDRALEEYFSLSGVKCTMTSISIRQ